MNVSSFTNLNTFVVYYLFPSLCERHYLSCFETLVLIGGRNKRKLGSLTRFSSEKEEDRSEEKIEENLRRTERR